MDTLTSRTIKGYEIRERVGEGGFGAVYRAFQPAVGREVAIKVILPKYANQPDFIRRFEVEAQFIARLEHPHIVPLYDYWRDPDGAYLVMRWLRHTLHDSLERGKWTLESTARLLDQLATALSVAHREGIVHRDLKPENILLDEDNNAYLADFGIAQDIHLREVLSVKEEGLIGSPAYISPEQIRSENVTLRSDLYSLGYVVYEMLTGHKPFPDSTTASDYIQKHLTTPLPMISIEQGGIPAAVDEVLRTATAKDPSHRYANAERFAAAFRAVLPASLPRTLPQPLTDPLTERELEVLSLMVDGLSNAEIAERLFLTPGTVRWYYKQIYPKLDVHSRQQAIDRAKRLNLIKRPGQISVTPPGLVDHPTTRGVEIKKPLLDPENPYKGLRAFRESDAADFYGRAGMTERLLSRLSEKGDSARFLAIIGPSGSGKSSLARAGLIPALRTGALPDAPHPFIAEMMPGSHPLEELEAALLRVSVNPLPGMLEQLRDDRRGLVRAAKRVLPTDTETELILLVDQFEEVFTLVTDETVRMTFIDNLLSAATDPRGRVRIILTLRADFYDRPLLYPRLAEMVRAGTEVIVPLTAREMEQAILAPAERVGLRFEAGLIATILKDVSEQPGTLPLLQYALTELYERREDLMLTLAAYNAMGGVMGALARRADEIYAALDPASQSLARQLFLRLVTLGEGTEDTRRRVLLAEAAGLGAESEMDDVIDAFANYRLLTLDYDPVTRSPTVEIAHEALLREWTLLREWLADARDEIRIQRRLNIAAEEWQVGRDASYLASGVRLTEFEAWAAASTLALTPAERSYLDASLAERRQQETAEAQRQKREQGLERRSRTFLRALVVVMALALLGAFGLTAFAFNERANSEANFNRAEQQRLYLAADEALDDGASGNVGMALALRSLQRGYSPGADAALMRASRQGIIRQDLTGHHVELFDGRYSPDGSLIATSSEGGTRLYDAATGTEIRFLPQEGIVTVIDFSPDGDSLLTGSSEGSLFIWEIASGAQRLISDTDQEVTGVWFSPDGNKVIALLFDSTLVWDAASGDLLATYQTEPNESYSAAPLYDLQGELRLLITETSGHIFVGDENRQPICTLVEPGADEWTIITWFETVEQPLFIIPFVDPISGNARIESFDYQTCERIASFDQHEGRVFSLDLVPNSDEIISGDETGLAIRWNWRTGREISRFITTSQMHFLDISPDGVGLLLDRWNIASVWDLAFPSHPRTIIIPDQFNHVLFPRFSPDGEDIYLGGFGAYSRWSWDDADAPLITYDLPIRVLDISPDGEVLVAATEQTTGGISDFSLFLIDADTGETLREYVGHTQLSNFLDFSPDGTRFISGSWDLTARIWDVATGETLHVLSDNAGVIGRAVFSPDGKTVLTTSTAGAAYLWNADTGEQLRTFDHAGATVFFGEFSPDGRLIATSDSEFGHIWDVATGEERHTLIGHSDNVFSIAFSPDGTQVVTASWDGTVRIWDVATGTLLRIFDAGMERMYAAVFSPDGTQIVAGAPLGDRAYIWDVSLDAVIDSFCARHPVDLTPEERAQYGITDTDPTCP